MPIQYRQWISSGLLLSLLPDNVFLAGMQIQHSRWISVGLLLEACCLILCFSLGCRFSIVAGFLLDCC